MLNLYRFRPRGRIALALLLTVLMGLTSVQAAPQVVVSIKPLQELVGAVMDGVAEPRLLVPPGQSPHTWSLKPSDAAAVSGAGLVVWIGPGLETSLARALRGAPAGQPRLEVESLPGILLLPARVGGDWEKRRRDGADNGQGHAHGTSNADPHLWLSPDNARQIVAAVAQRLSELDEVNAVRYRANAARFTQELDTLDAQLKARLAPLADRPFIVFHDAYQYFEKHYGLRAVGSVLVSPEQMPGVRRVSELRDKVRSLGAVCVFAEPQFPPALVDTLIEGTPARRGTLDPLGMGLSGGYPALLSQMGEDLARCLEPK